VDQPDVGRERIYTGDERGNVSAIDEATGRVIWSTSIGTGDSIYSTPLISSDLSSVWIGTDFNAGFWKLDAATGNIDCHIKSVTSVQGSPLPPSTVRTTPAHSLAFRNQIAPFSCDQ